MERDSHEALLKKEGGFYRTLVEMQSSAGGKERAEAGAARSSDSESKALNAAPAKAAKPASLRVRSPQPLNIAEAGSDDGSFYAGPRSFSHKGGANNLASKNDGGEMGMHSFLGSPPSFLDAPDV